VHARHAWIPEQILWGHHFVDVLVTMPDGRRAIDYRRFHDVDRDGPPPGGAS
jgi:inward rectifier potassium channel